MFVRFTVLFASILLVACSGGSASTESSGPHGGAEGTDTPSQSTTTEPSPEGIACGVEVGLECEVGYTDGCFKLHPEDPTRAVTAWHICVEEFEDWAQYGPGCELELAKECGEGAVDACLLVPAPSDVHVCVLR